MRRGHLLGFQAVMPEVVGNPEEKSLNSSYKPLSATSFETGPQKDWGEKKQAGQIFIIREIRKS